VLYVPVTPPPEVSSQGGANEVEAGTDGPASAALAPPMPDEAPPPAMLNEAPGAGVRPAGAIVLDGEDQDRDVFCGGRDVLIHATGSRYRLRGGCRSVTVHGRANRIEAELQPGARISVGADDVRLDYALIREGPPPVVSVTGGGSEAIAIPRPGATSH
jgi:hypothetical protein